MSEERSPKRRPEYEFSEEENAHVSRLIGVMRFVGAAQPVVGLGLVAGAVFFAIQRSYGVAIALGAPAAFYLFVAGSVLGSASAFERVVTTKGNDVTNLLTALDSLRRVFVVQRVLIVIVGLMLGAATVAIVLSPKEGAGPVGSDGVAPSNFDGTR